MTKSPSVRVLVSLALVFGMFSVNVPPSYAAATSSPATAATSTSPTITTTTTVQTDDADPADTSEPQKNEEKDEDVIKELPTATTTRPATLRTYTVDSTAYTSTVEECDSDPFITADGSRVRDGIIAANFLPFGTKVRLPTVFGDRIFEVHDRMNKRYWYRVDIWMAKGRDMRQYGIKHSIPLEIVEWGTGDTQWKKLAAAKNK